ncbi:MAG: XRE family transcriptional regulator [Candidatus Sericytochromatia bacterium]
MPKQTPQAPTTEPQSQVSSYLAQNLRYLRGKKNWSQQQLADLAELPRTTLTHIESGQGNPSLANLVKLSAALGVGVEELLSRPRSACQLIPAAEIPVRKRSQGRVKVFNLLPDSLKGIAIERLELAGEASMGGQPHLPGTKEYLLVLQGTVAVYVAGEHYPVHQGDVFAFPGNQAHSYSNPQSQPAVAISVVIPVPATA